MQGSGNKIVDAVGQISITGNVTPQSWYKTITRPSGKPYLEAITILSDIVFWYRPSEVRDERTGEVVAHRKRFRADFLQRNYADISEQFGISKREATNAVVALERLGVIKRHLRTIDVHGTKMSNVLFLELVPSALRALTFGEVIAPTFESDSSHLQKGEVSPLEVIAPTSRSETNTENTTENTTETSTETTTIPDTASTAAAKKPKATVAEKKERFGEYGNVMLTADDVEKLQDRFPADWRERVENLSAYMESTGKTYRNHRATIENWARMDEERARRDSPSRGRAASPSKAAPVRDEPSVEDVMRDCLCDRETALEIIKEGLA